MQTAWIRMRHRVNRRLTRILAGRHSDNISPTLSNIEALSKLKQTRNLADDNLFSELRVNNHRCALPVPHGLKLRMLYLSHAYIETGITSANISDVRLYERLTQLESEPDTELIGVWLWFGRFDTCSDVNEFLQKGLRRISFERECMLGKVNAISLLFCSWLYSFTDRNIMKGIQMGQTWILARFSSWKLRRFIHVCAPLVQFSYCNSFEIFMSQTCKWNVSDKMVKKEL